MSIWNLVKGLKKITSKNKKKLPKSPQVLNCLCSISTYYRSTVLKQLLHVTKRKRASHTWTEAPHTQEHYRALLTSHFTEKNTYFLVLNADTKVHPKFARDSAKSQYAFYKYCIKKSLRGKPYKNTHYQVYPEFGDKTAKLHCNLIIHLDYYPYVKSLVHDLRRNLTGIYAKTNRFSCTLPKTYGRKPCHYAIKDAIMMYNMNLCPIDINR